MSSDPIERLVRDAVQLTGAALPPLLTESSPALSLAETSHNAPPFYLIGLIGGKDVGKSSLAQAIAGVKLGTPANTGEGTRDAIAYVHRDNEHLLTALLDSIVPGRYAIVVHEHAPIRSQVLIDLPDIDSKYADHIELTRSVLRHLLFPIFVQSIEKYADQRPQQLLAQVAEGNDPANFLFCLNKVDQLVARDGEPASVALAEDYARRLQQLMSLKSPPRVFRISAAQPGRFDLPGLRSTLARERDASSIRRSLELAAGRRQWTLLRWLDDQRFEDRLARADRTLAEARSLAEDKLLTPIATRIIPRLLDDAVLRAEITETAARKRIARWPIVNVVDVLLAPITSLFRRNGLSLSSASRQSVRAVIAEQTPTLEARLRSLFADLRRREPSVADAYGTTPPWEDAASENAVADLTTRLTDAVETRKKRVAEQAGLGHGRTSAPLRWLLTIGAIVWFPIAQPILEIVLHPEYTFAGMTTRTAWQIVQLLGTTYLLRSIGFLAIYFVLLWAAIRFSTGRTTERLLTKLDAGKLHPTPQPLDADIGEQASEWVDDLLSPIEAQSRELRSLVDRVEAARRSFVAA